MFWLLKIENHLPNAVSKSSMYLISLEIQYTNVLRNQISYLSFIFFCQNDGIDLAKPITSYQKIGHSKFRAFGAPLRPDSERLAPNSTILALNSAILAPSAPTFSDSPLKVGKFRSAPPAFGASGAPRNLPTFSSESPNISA